jgi:glyceraldehyde 3-phosphate dehydrogenase
MSVKIAINGFGRIRRLVLRSLVENGRDDLIPVAINNLGSIQANAHSVSQRARTLPWRGRN